MNNPYQEYMRNAVETASPEERLLMIWGRLNHYLRQTEAAFANQNLEAIHINLVGAQKAISVLKESLDFNLDLSKTFYAVYDYMENRLTDANVEKTLEPVLEVKKMATELEAAWRTGIEQHLAKEQASKSN